MESKRADMMTFFSQLSERNKDVVILVAKSVKVAQEVTVQYCKSAEG